MTPATFIIEDGFVIWLAPRRVRLSPTSVEGLLTIFHDEGAAALFNELHELHVELGGIPRCSSFRSLTLVSDNSDRAPRDRVRAMLAASVALGDGDAA